MKQENFFLRTFVFILFLTFVLASCHRPACKTAWGKKKLKYYNSIQYN